ncbi:MAG: glycosyltransferase [Thermoanaerobaculum sp.]
MRLTPLRSLLVLVPSRGEGERVRGTLESVLAAGGDRHVTVFFVLDGPDPVARRVAEQLGNIRILEKPLPGPTKSAVLRFAAENLQKEIESVDAVMVLDVGSRLSSSFFESLAWPEGVSAFQTTLVGEGVGPGEAAGLSERIAQGVWDLGRQGLGWSVRLRGTGTVFRPSTFLAVVPELVTQIEDTEASLLITARGERTALLPGPAVVLDQKPSSLEEASSQRARWLAGQWQILRNHWRVLLRLFLRRPLEGLNWMAFLLSRPLSLTLPLRLLGGATMIALGIQTHAALGVGWGALVAGSALAELGWLVVFHPKAFWPAVSLALAWVQALPRVFGAGRRWYRGRRT